MFFKTMLDKKKIEAWLFLNLELENNEIIVENDHGSQWLSAMFLGKRKLL